MPDLGGAEPEDRGVERGVIAAAEFGMKPGSELEDRGDGSLRLQRAAGRTRDAAEELEQGALAGAVLADDADRLAAFDVEGNVLQRWENRVPRPARDRFDQTIDGAPVDVVLLRQLRSAYGDSHCRHCTDRTAKASPQKQSGGPKPATWFASRSNDQLWPTPRCFGGTTGGGGVPLTTLTVWVRSTEAVPTATCTFT